jgi:hypothetical protein
MDKDAINYRFSGYRLPMLQLDETGDSYIQIPFPHKYYTEQPFYYTKPYYYGHPNPKPQYQSSEKKLYPFLEGNENL